MKVPWFPLTVTRIHWIFWGMFWLYSGRQRAMGSQGVLNAYLLYDPVSKHFPQSQLFGKLLRNRAGNHGLQNARFFERTTTTTKIPKMLEIRSWENESWLKAKFWNSLRREKLESLGERPNTSVWDCFLQMGRLLPGGERPLHGLRKLGKLRTLTRPSHKAARGKSTAGSEETPQWSDLQTVPDPQEQLSMFHHPNWLLDDTSGNGLGKPNGSLVCHLCSLLVK